LLIKFLYTIDILLSRDYIGYIPLSHFYASGGY
jgi:hypothetical protein